MRKEKLLLSAWRVAELRISQDYVLMGLKAFCFFLSVFTALMLNEIA